MAVSQTAAPSLKFFAPPPSPKYPKPMVLVGVKLGSILTTEKK
jgi:hypothetical protein